MGQFLHSSPTTPHVHLHPHSRAQPRNPSVRGLQVLAGAPNSFLKNLCQWSDDTGATYAPPTGEARAYAPQEVEQSDPWDASRHWPIGIGTGQGIGGKALTARNPGKAMIS